VGTISRSTEQEQNKNTENEGFHDCHDASTEELGKKERKERKTRSCPPVNLAGGIILKRGGKLRDMTIRALVWREKEKWGEDRG